MTVTSGEPGTPGRRLERHLRRDHGEVERELVVAEDEGGDTRRQVGGERAMREPRRVVRVVVQLVAGEQGAPLQLEEVERTGVGQRAGEAAAEHAVHPAQPLDHVGPVRAVAQHPARALVERAPRARHRSPGRRRRAPASSPSRRRSSARRRRSRGSAAAPPRRRRRGRAPRRAWRPRPRAPARPRARRASAGTCRRARSAARHGRRRRRRGAGRPRGRERRRRAAASRPPGRRSPRLHTARCA